VTVAHLDKTSHAIGLMSGTSADGIDAALVQITGSGAETRVDLMEFDFVPFPSDLRDTILRSSEISTARVDEICRLDVILGEWFAKAALVLCVKAGEKPEMIDFIGSHGQTIHHLPELTTVHEFSTRSSLQLGDPSVIAERTGITTISDFRARDLAAGGQGAPLVPIVDYLLYASAELSRVLLNIGGIANLTHVPAGCALEEVIAFDTGPGNMLLDALVMEITNGALSFDRDGEIASRGTESAELLNILMANPYLTLEPPKSTGREMFGHKAISEILTWRGKISDEDLVATLTSFTVESIADAIDRHVTSRETAEEILVSGGGAKNPSLMRLLETRLKKHRIRDLEALGMLSEAKEAVAFAVLANETVSGKPGNVPGATGATHPVVLGVIAPGAGARFSVD